MLVIMIFQFSSHHEEYYLLLYVFRLQRIPYFTEDDIIDMFNNDVWFCELSQRIKLVLCTWGLRLENISSPLLTHRWQCRSLCTAGWLTASCINMSKASPPITIPKIVARSGLFYFAFTHWKGVTWYLKRREMKERMFLLIIL